MLARLCSAILISVFFPSIQTAIGADLNYYDPTFGDTQASLPYTTTAEVDIQPQSRFLTIPRGFYGLNIHPGSWKYEFARPDLLKRLKPDAIRIMTLRRTDWIPGRREISDLSLGPGKYDWTELDLLVKGIVDLGSEPYLALGFGPPSWISGAKSPLERKPPLDSQLANYADFMATIVHRYAVEKGYPLRRVTVDNEPENVGYDIDNYIQLFRLAKERIKARAPQVQVGGPVTGYAVWTHPGKPSLDFGRSTNIFARDRTPFDYFDWHIYSTFPNIVMRTVQAVKKAYGDSLPLVISELNRDWRFGGKDFAKSVQNNTSWVSVSWLAYVLDHLQVAGVDQAFYFVWREAALGLADGRLTMLRPNFYLFAAMTNLLGRQRVVSKSSHPTIGSIVTNDNGRIAVLLYNRADNDVRVTVRGATLKSRFVFSRPAFEAASSPEVDLLTDPKLSDPASNRAGDGWMVPAGGFVVLESK